LPAAIAETAEKETSSVHRGLDRFASLPAMDIPEDLRYSSDHEWVRVEGNEVRIGITDYAQDALGDVVFVELPEVGASVKRGDSFSEVESTKSVSEVYAPISGSVTQVNTELTDNPERLNDDPYGDGWVCVIAVADEGELAQLLDAEGYRSLIEG
jgi:glycine cleavage system H protein